MIITILMKNLKMILRSPSTVLLLILAPMILMFLIGLTYNNVDNLNKVQVGYFGADAKYFSNLGVVFIEYDEKSIEESELSCKNDLKRGFLELCVFIQIQEENDKLSSAQLVYISDNTRSTMGNILISAFERELRKKTDEISTTTISGILGEVDSTLLFMEDTKELVSDVDSSLLELQSEIKKNDIQIKQTISILKINLPKAVNLLENTLESLEQLEEINEGDLDSTKDQLEELDDSIEDLQDAIDDVEDSIENNLGFVPEDIEDDLNAMRFQLDIIFILTNDVSKNLDDILGVLDRLSISEIIINLEDLKDSLEELTPVVNELDTQYSQLKTALDDTSNEVNTIKMEVDEKYDYFSELSKQDSSKIIKPISSSTKPLFKQFSRVHELAPTIIVVVMLFIGLLLSNVIVSMEMNSKAYFRNIISPVHQTSFIIGLFFTSLIIILFQLLFFFVILQFVFNVPVFGIFDIGTQSFVVLLFWDTLLITIHVLLVFILLGMLFSLMFSSIQISVLVTTFAMLFFFLLSDIILPLELMPDFFYNVIGYNPVVLAQNLFRELFFFSEIYFFDISRFLPFYVYTLVLVILIAFAKNSKKKQLLN